MISDKVYARVGAKVLVRNSEGKILILRRSATMSRPGGWDFPGGACNFGEAMEDTAIRETQEETGLKIQDLKLSITHSYIDNSDEYVVLVGFSATTRSSTVRISEEHDFYEWITLSEAKRRELPDFHAKLLKAAL